MASLTRPRGLGRLAAVAAALAAAGYAGYAARSWFRYGHVDGERRDSGDELLDRFMPRYDVVEQHETAVSAPADVTLASACEQELGRVPAIRALFAARSLFMGAKSRDIGPPAGLLDQVRALGWGELAHIPGREIVMGAVTQPWHADVVFRALPPDSFADFAEPGFVKIAWTLGADPDGDGRSIFRTETRAVGTDADAKRRFRRYWMMVSPGVALIRRLSLAPLRREAARRARMAKVAS